MSIKSIEDFRKIREEAAFKTDRVSAAQLNSSDWKFQFAERYRNPTYESAADTFLYVYQKYKKGIFARVNGRQLRFGEIDNKYYVNDWHKKVDFGAFAFGPAVQDPKHWYANNYLVRYEKPFTSSVHGLAELTDMFTELCATYPVPNVEVFINRRDFPLLRRDGREAYNAIHGDLLDTSCPEKPCLILSLVSSPDFCDIPIPTPEDWSRVSEKTFSRTKRAQLSVFRDSFQKDWRNKRDMFVFRGSNTGINFGEKRIQLCELCQDDERCDVKLTSISDRAQIINGVLQVPVESAKREAARFLGKPLTLQEQSEYKYIVHIAGHVQSYRLSAELATFSTILYVESRTKLWFEQKLEPWKHYVPVREDMSDLREQMVWCELNQDKCEEIALEARRFYDMYLTKKSCLDYLYHLICSYRVNMLPVMYLAPARAEPPNRASNSFIRPAGKLVPMLSQNRCYLRILEMSETLSSRAKMLHAIRREGKVAEFLLTSSGATCVSIKKGASRREAAFGIERVNPLLQDIPNFVYTYGMNEDNTGLYLECVEEKPLTLSDYIKSRAFQFDTFLCILKQIALSLAHAQNRCCFIHGRADPSFILLCQLGYREFDYCVPGGDVWRCTTEQLVPIWFNYERAEAIGYEKGPRFESFRDCIRVLVKSAREAIHHRCLSQKHLQRLLELFNQIFEGTDGLFYVKLPDARTLSTFIHNVGTEEYLSSANIGDALLLSPMVLFSAIENQNFKIVDGVSKTHFGKVSSIHSAPLLDSKRQPFLIRHDQQRLARASEGTHAELYLRGIEPAQNISAGWKLDEVASARLELLNIFESLLSDASKYALSPEEKKELREKVERALKLKYTLWKQQV